MFGDASLWRLLNPQESIEEREPLQPANTSYRIPADEVQNQLESLVEDGYCLIPSLIDAKKIDRMRSCALLMLQKKIPPVYCFVYDIFWQLILELDPVLRVVLGGDYHLIQNAWTWVVDSNKSANYFEPHRDLGVDGDFIDELGMPTLLSVWIPLTDVSTKSSCMYLLPASRDPEYPLDALHWREKYDKEGHRPWKTKDLVNIRALPAAKGSFLAWNAGVFHWGSEPHPKAPPRISIGYYFHAAHAKKKYPDLIDLKKPFPCQDRLGVILGSIQRYGKSLNL